MSQHSAGYLYSSVAGNASEKITNLGEGELRPLISCYEMFHIHARKFLFAFRDLQRVDAITRQNSENTKIPSDDKYMHRIADGLIEDFEGMGLPVTLKSVKRLKKHVESGDATLNSTREAVNEINNRLTDEIEHRFWLYLDDQEAYFYISSDQHFGSDVLEKFPDVSTDIDESSKCYALGRYTACVFHLMRVMEHCVQQFGEKIGVQSSDEKNWQVILDQINKKLKGLDHNDQLTKKYAEISADLYSVKLAWRNETMHPKATYTKEEADKILRSVRDFTQDLSKVI